MENNPLVPADEKRGKGKGKVTAEMLYDLADRLNKTNFARGLGWKYHVGQGEDGKRFLDRRDIAPDIANYRV